MIDAKKASDIRLAAYAAENPQLYALNLIADSETTDEDILDIFGVAALGDLPTAKPRTNPEARPRAVELVRGGMSRAEAAKAVGAALSSVNRWCNEDGIASSCEPKAEKAEAIRVPYEKPAVIVPPCEQAAPVPVPPSAADVLRAKRQHVREAADALDRVLFDVGAVLPSGMCNDLSDANCYLLNVADTLQYAISLVEGAEHEHGKD